MASAAETIARETREHSLVLRTEFDALRDQVHELELLALRERVKVLEESVSKLAKTADESIQLREQVAVLKDQMAEVKKAKDQTDNRLWNVLMIAVGAVLSLLGGVVVQLVAFAIKK
jgi:cell shape-determining protein MreC